jgi:adenosine deaminase
VPLTVCPLSNVSLRVVDDIASHPLSTMLERGIRVTVNSDDPAYFGGCVDDNLDALTQAGQLPRADLVTLARNSIEASFADPMLGQPPQTVGPAPRLHGQPARPAFAAD